MQKATNLEEAIFIFDPLKPLRNREELDAFYVDRGSDVRSHFSLMLRASDIRQQEPIKLLFTGHKGCGKSTELNKLVLELQELFFIVKVQTGKRPDVTYIDVLLKAAMSLFRAAIDEGAIKRAPAQIATDLLDDISRFVEKKIFGDVSVSEKTSKLTEVTAKISAYAVEFEGKFELEPDSREAIRKISERQITELIDKINLLSDQIRLKYQKPVLFLFEDTDKLDMAVARALFYERAATLTQFRASAIFLMDIGLRYSASFATLQQNFHDFKVLPNVKLKTRDGQPLPAGRALLETLVLNRLEASLISDEALQIIVTSSGGLSRTLVSLMRDAALIAAARNAQRIEANDAERAVNRLRGNFIALLNSSDYPALLARHEDKRLNADEETQNLLEKLALLEYANDENWCDVHPILMPEVARRTLAPVEHPVAPVPQPYQ